MVRIQYLMYHNDDILKIMVCLLRGKLSFLKMHNLEHNHTDRKVTWIDAGYKKREYFFIVYFVPHAFGYWGPELEGFLRNREGS